jgi:hypothetical protein
VCAQDRVDLGSTLVATPHGYGDHQARNRGATARHRGERSGADAGRAAGVQHDRAQRHHHRHLGASVGWLPLPVPRGLAEPLATAAAAGTDVTIEFANTTAAGSP